MAAAHDAGSMNPEELKELKELIEFLKDNKIGEFDLERGDLKVRLKFAQDAPAAGASALDLAGLNRLLSAAPARCCRSAGDSGGCGSGSCGSVRAGR